MRHTWPHSQRESHNQPEERIAAGAAVWQVRERLAAAIAHFFRPATRLQP